MPKSVPAKDSGDLEGLHAESCLFQHLALYGIGRRFSRIDGSGGEPPLAVVRPADEQQLSRIVMHQRSDPRQ